MKPQYHPASFFANNMSGMVGNQGAGYDHQALVQSQDYSTCSYGTPAPQVTSVSGSAYGNYDYPSAVYQQQCEAREWGSNAGLLPGYGEGAISSSYLKAPLSPMPDNQDTPPPAVDNYYQYGVISTSSDNLMRPSSNGGGMSNISNQCDRKPYLTPPHSTSLPSSMPSPPTSNTPHSFYDAPVKYSM